MKIAKRAKRGVTLVEIAIVLVIIGLLLGGILKGQELINNAKVKNMISYQEALRGAWYAFIDRYEAVPGDWTRASQFLAINQSAVINGQGNGFINENESPLVFTHLVAAGFIRCAVCDDGTAGHANESEWKDKTPQDPDPTGIGSQPSPENSPTNSYGGVVGIFHDVSYYHGRSSGNFQAQLMAHSGPRVPSNLARDVDNKIDDGYANSGDVRMNNFSTQEGTGGDAQTGRDEPGTYELASRTLKRALETDKATRVICRTGRARAPSMSAFPNRTPPLIPGGLPALRAARPTPTAASASGCNRLFYLPTFGFCGGLPAKPSRFGREGFAF